MGFEDILLIASNAEFCYSTINSNKKYLCILSDGTIIKTLNKIAKYFGISKSSLYQLLQAEEPFKESVIHLIKVGHYGKFYNRTLLKLDNGCTLSGLTCIAEYFDIPLQKIHNLYYKGYSLKDILIKYGVDKCCFTVINDAQY